MNCLLIVQKMKQELDQLLKQSISGTTYVGSYITSDPKVLEMLRKGNTFDRKRDPLEEVEMETEKPSKRRKHK